MKKKKLTKEDILNDETLGPQDKYKKYLTTNEWKQIHNEVLIRDNFTCQCCNRTQQEIDEYNTKKGKKLLSLVVHHKTYKNLFNEVETNYKDLITLCSLVIGRSIQHLITEIGLSLMIKRVQQNFAELSFLV